MNKNNYEIYMIAIINLLINDNNKTDFGNYILEYDYCFSEIGGGDMYNGDACLAVAVRLKNKTSKLIEWGNVYYKRLIRDSSVYSVEARKKIEKIFGEIYASSKEKKLDFILRSENRITKKPYATNMLVDPKIVSFFKNLNGTAEDGFPIVRLGGKIPKEVIPFIDAAFNCSIDNIKNSSNKRKI